MEYTRLSGTGLGISRLCLGCWNFGSEESWMVGDQDDAHAIIDRPIDAGINVLDTANVYSHGESERIVGNAIQGRRDELVVTSKVFGRMREGPHGQGLSHKHVLEQVDRTLDRFGTDYLDRYQIHRWDEHTPIEETLPALSHLVDEGTEIRRREHDGRLAVHEGPLRGRPARIRTLRLDATGIQPRRPPRGAEPPPRLSRPGGWHAGVVAPRRGVPGGAVRPRGRPRRRESSSRRPVHGTALHGGELGRPRRRS